jgi:uncharacterized membrane protein YkoI
LEKRIMKRLTTFALVAACSLAAASLSAQQPARTPVTRGARARTYKREVPDSLLSQVKISEDSARAIALRQVRGGRVQALELEFEDGALLYSWDIKVPGKPGITEVHVSATDGKVLKVEHEDN